MKLATRYLRSNLIATLVLFLLTGIAFYISLHRILLFQVDEDIEIEQHQIETMVERDGSLSGQPLAVEDQIVTYEKTSSPLRRTVRSTADMHDSLENKTGPYRLHTFTITSERALYKVTIAKSLESTEVLTRHIALIGLTAIGLLLILSFFINRVLLRRLWRPFYETMDRVQSFDLEDRQPLVLPKALTDEFTLMNKTLQVVTAKAVQDYAILKEFTENASHEMQTPLAIIRSKLDLMIQDEDMTERQSETIQESYLAVNRLAYLNQSLLMLAKIEAGQFEQRTVCDLKEMLDEKLSMFDSMIASRELSVETDLQAVSLQINAALADILLNNLLSNAIFHNQDGGKIKISLANQQLEIRNSSWHPGSLDTKALFTRFYKVNGSATRTGLGLALAKQVCEASACSLTYAFSAGMHCFVVRWQSPPASESTQSPSLR